MYAYSIRYDSCMSADQNNPLLPIFQLKHKSELTDYCAGLEVSSRALLEIVLRSRASDFSNYNYVCHVLHAVPRI